VELPGSGHGRGIDSDVAVADAALAQVLEVLGRECQRVEVLRHRWSGEAAGLKDPPIRPQHPRRSDVLQQGCGPGVDEDEADDEDLVVLSLRKDPGNDPASASLLDLVPAEARAGQTVLRHRKLRPRRERAGAQRQGQGAGRRSDR